MSSRFEYPVPGLAPSLLSVAAPEEAAAAPGGGLWRLLAGTTLAGAMLGAAMTFVWPQAYVATSEMLIDPVALPPEASLAVVENQLRLLRSGVMLNAAVDRLNLAADPEFNGDEAGPFGVAGALAGFGELVAGDGSTAMEQRRRRAIERLAGAMNARQEPGSALVSLSVRTSDPEKSALIANTVSGLFLDTIAGAPADGTSLASLRDDLAAAEQAVADFRRDNDLPDAGEARQLASEIETARGRMATLTAQARTMEGLDTMATGSVGPASHPQPVAEALARQANARRRVESLATRLGPRHPELLAARADLEGAGRELETQKRQAAEALREQMQQAERAQQEAASRLSGSGAGGEEKLAALRELERAAETRRAAYEDALGASAGGVPAAAAGMRVLSQAEPPLAPAGPSAPMLTIAGALGGLLAGLGFTGWRRMERQDGEPADDDDRFGDEHQQYEADRDDDEERLPETAYEAKETEPMYPYPPHLPPSAQGPHEAQPDHRPMGYAPQPAYVQQPAPGWYPPAPHDPWAHARPYAPHAPYYGHPAAPTVVYVPVPAQPPTAPLDPYERDRYIDRRTDLAIEEIRQSLRALREAIEDFADDRYGT